MAKVIIAGSREGFLSTDVFKATEQAAFDITEVVSGCARGVDMYGEDYAVYNKLPIKKFPAQWDKDGKAAGFIRNSEMAEYADALVAVWDGESKGTKHMIETMQKLGKPVYIYKR